MLRLMPLIADPMAMTTMTPMATPRMVSAARTLLARSESSAIAEPSSMPGEDHSALSATMGSSREARLAG